MIDTYRKLYELLDARERRNAYLLFAIIVVMGLLELIGVASIFPFMSVLSDPGIVERNQYLNAVYKGLGFESTSEFLILLGTATFVLVVGSLAFKAFAHWVMARYVNMRNYTLGSRLLRGYLARPYTFFLNRHSADLGKRVLSEVSQVIGGCLKPAVDLVANTTVSAFLVALLITVNPFVAACAVLVLGGAYASTYMVIRGRLNRMGKKRVNANHKRFQVIQEALGGIKDVKVLGLEDGYIHSFRKPAYRFAQVRTNAQMIGEIPRFAFQALVYGGVLAILLSILMTEGNDLGAILPLVTLYAVAASRLIPALQNIYKAVTSLRFGKPALDQLYDDFMDTGAAALPVRPASDVRPFNETERLPLRSQLEMENVSYTYPGADKPALESITLAINARTTVGFVGSTGAGKTTAIDVLLGLLEPSKGCLVVDGERLSSSIVSAWQRNIGYVPQHIYLTDDSIAANIAFGSPTGLIDVEAVEKAARVAELHEFVVEGLPHGYRTTVGERGVRLSGGQRQRIGIARALYRDPDVLVFDEATSALDTVTESAVMDAVHNLGDRKTIIIIAHRLSTVRACDNIFLLEKGRLVGSGTYEQLLKENERFEAMVAG